MPEENTLQEASVFGKRFGNGGGVANAVTECLKETGENADINVMKCDGTAECKKALLLLKAGRLPADLADMQMYLNQKNPEINLLVRQTNVIFTII